MAPSPPSGPVSPWIAYLLLLLLSMASLVKSKPSPHIANRQIDRSPPRNLAGPLLSDSRLEARHTLPGALLDFMGRQRKFKGRTRKSSVCLVLKATPTGASGHLGC